ncbi:uncharacterized protein LOC113505292 isoform X2 [Trichoplusia ni]|nr:uncharacterized protein LOC113505292 isoform X2 [Trichoplusia ni]XP_026743715.1 uncharacterized protein LOC113505292 isoform X2 [Trichoplusia ni]
MDRERRDADGENSLWANPCDYNDSQSKPVIPQTHAREVAMKLVVQAKSTYSKTAKYKEEFALKLHSYPSFDALLTSWRNQEFLKAYSWLPEEGLPKEKVLNETMSDEYMTELMPKIDEVLPGMYKGLKMIVAGLYAFTTEELNAGLISDEPLRDNLTRTMHDSRAVLCYFNDIMNIRNLKILKLSDSEIPTDFGNNMGVLLYRDTMNFLQYLEQVFRKLYDMDS